MAQRDATDRESAVAVSGQSSLLRWLGLVPWAVLALMVSLQVTDPGSVFESLRYQFFDFLQRQNPRQYVDTGVRYVDIDEESIKRIGQWPWPRTTVAKLVRELGNDGAAVVAFDIVFAEPDATSPDQISKRLPQSADFDPTRTQLSALPHNDTVLAGALRDVTTVTGFAFTDRKAEHKPAFKGSYLIQLNDFVKKHPDATLEEIKEHFSGKVNCSLVAIHHTLKRLGWRYKKKHYEPVSKTEKT